MGFTNFRKMLAGMVFFWMFVNGIRNETFFTVKKKKQIDNYRTKEHSLVYGGLNTASVVNSIKSNIDNVLNFYSGALLNQGSDELSGIVLLCKLEYKFKYRLNKRVGILCLVNCPWGERFYDFVSGHYVMSIIQLGGGVFFIYKKNKDIVYSGNMTLNVMFGNIMSDPWYKHIGLNMRLTLIEKSKTNGGLCWGIRFLNLDFGTVFKGNFQNFLYDQLASFEFYIGKSWTVKVESSNSRSH